MIRLWIISWLQRRQERRVARLERIADQLIIDADSDYARYLGILPPMPAPLQPGAVVLFDPLLGPAPTQQEIRFAQLYGSHMLPPLSPGSMMLHNAQQSKRARRIEHLFQQMGGLSGGLLGNAGLGSAMGGALGGALSELLGKGGRNDHH